MLHFEGDVEFLLAADILWTKLSDASFVASCIPGVEKTARAEPEIAVCTIRPGFSFVRGTLEITLRVTDAESPTTVRYRINGKGIGSSNTIEAALAIVARGAGSLVHWSADVTELGGLLKAVPQGLLKASAQKVINDLLASLQSKLAAQDSK